MTEESSDEKAERIALAEAKAAAVSLLLERGLYSHLDTREKLGEDVVFQLRHAEANGFDTFCVKCRRETTFRIRAQAVLGRTIGGQYASQIKPPPIFATFATCQRCFHVYSYIFIETNDRLTKIGQLPSMGDLSQGELRAFSQSLSEIDRSELSKALGLFSHDSAIGAFVYLRRVFERMIFRTYERMPEPKPAADDFRILRMHERIDVLKNELPRKVVDNSRLFTILSLGIHELSEEQCASMFTVVKLVLFQMLEEEDHRRQRAAQEKKVDAEFNRILVEHNPKVTDKNRKTATITVTDTRTPK
ncbi:MAG: hypothetical protein JWL96_1981 [Sphingomonas bacterium]|uniref:hypothetical protein n=1 Tax=Sphingomonas bacterium TaxID=1895847 RepID=UPI00261057AF|nr:hypothetical protein [Sphingomonas bacterium]MDB5709911.1 hypothetical protein [Sphingomonas bacterium]